MKTRIYKTYIDFLNREDKKENGVSEEFAKLNPDFESDNETNKACWDCSGCSRCSDCSGCSGCSGCWDCWGCSGCWDCWGCSDCSDCSDCSRCSGCWDCSDCSRCSGCWDCSDCSRCSGCSGCSGKKGALKAPKVENLNKKVLKSVSDTACLDMESWHSECGTTHCWAGWIVTLAGSEGKSLEEETSTLFAAMMIFKESTDNSISPCNFFLSNDEALEKIKELASN